MNPHALHVYTDGASDYDSGQTGGLGYRIEFPDHIEIEPMEGFLNVNGQGIHRLELQGIIFAMDKVLEWAFGNSDLAKKITGGVIFHTDRHSLSDTELTGAYRISGWRKNKWNKSDETPVKHRELLDKLDKKRKKISGIFGGKVEIIYTREKHNKKADRLSKVGKKSLVREARFGEVQNIKTAKRKYSGPEIDYKLLKSGQELYLHCYRKVKIESLYELFFDICGGEFEGSKIRCWVPYDIEAHIHRFHTYKVTVKELKEHSIVISDDFSDVT